jgi:hypothetical protein
MFSCPYLLQSSIPHLYLYLWNSSGYLPYPFSLLSGSGYFHFKFSISQIWMADNYPFSLLSGFGYFHFCFQFLEYEWRIIIHFHCCPDSDNSTIISIFLILEYERRTDNADYPPLFGVNSPTDFFYLLRASLAYTANERTAKLVCGIPHHPVPSQKLSRRNRYGIHETANSI